MSNKQRVEPRTLKGFQDLFPAEIMVRKSVVSRIEEVFQRYGFAPVETPALEYLDVLLGSGGENANKELFRLESPEGEPVALRFDLTVPFARMLAQYPDKLKVPFRRYAIGPVWRADKPGPGRYRQFVQFDADVVGADSIAVDAEIVAIMCEVMAALGTSRYTAVVNNRRLIDALLEGLGITEPNRRKHVCRVIDKLTKVGPENVRLELGPGRVDESGDPIPGMRLDTGTIDTIIRFIEIKGDTRGEIIHGLCGQLSDSPSARHAIDEMAELDECLRAMGVSEDRAVFAPSLARGLDYYTGPVFEMILPDAPQFGSVMGGGRYDALVQRFSDRPISGTGTSVGLDRLIAALDHIGLVQKDWSHIDALIVTIGKAPRTETLKLAAELRAAGIRTEAFFAARKKMTMTSQLSHADHYGVPVAVIIGEDELANGVVSIKNLREGKRQRDGIEDRDAYREAGKTAQITVPRHEMIAKIRQLLHK